MATINENGQTCLEVNGIEKREHDAGRSEYNFENPYGVTHPNALSDGDPKGKGTGGSHTSWQPYCEPGETHGINYKNFNTSSGGGSYDIEGRNGIGGRRFAMTQSLYNQENPYGLNLISTVENQRQGQYYFGKTTKNL